jgi:hypothetical protein
LENFVCIFALGNLEIFISNAMPSVIVVVKVNKRMEIQIEERHKEKE